MEEDLALFNTEFIQELIYLIIGVIIRISGIRIPYFFLTEELFGLI